MINRKYLQPRTIVLITKKVSFEVGCESESEKKRDSENVDSFAAESRSEAEQRRLLPEVNEALYAEKVQEFFTLESIFFDFGFYASLPKIVGQTERKKTRGVEET